MPRKCVFGCDSPGNTFHVFPNPDKFPERFRAWVNSVGGKLETPSDFEYFRKKRVCDLHFKDADRNRFDRLNALAIPTPICQGGPISDISQQNVSDQLNPVPSASWTSSVSRHSVIQEHNYFQSLHTRRKNDETMQDDTTVPVESQDVQENIETTPDAPIELVQDEYSQLDPELLPALVEPTDEQPIYGENINQTLAQLWIPLLKEGLSKDLKEKILKEYRIPENCKLLKAPTLNSEIKAAVSECIINRDKNIQLRQDQLGLGISVINKAITLLLDGDDKIEAIKILCDSCRILTDLHYTETQIRTKLITPSLDKSFIPFIKDHERDETLFGEKLSETIKASKAIERQGSLIKKYAQMATSLPAPTAGASTARTRFSGNGTGPPPYASVSRGGRGGHPRAATAYRRTATTMRPRVSPSQGKDRANTSR